MPAVRHAAALLLSQYGIAAIIVRFGWGAGTDCNAHRNVRSFLPDVAGLLLAHSHTDLALHLFNLNCRHLASAGEQLHVSTAACRLRVRGLEYSQAAVARRHNRATYLTRQHPASVQPTLQAVQVPVQPRYLSACLLSHPDTHERLAALCPTADGRLLLAAGTSGLVTLRWLHSLQVGGTQRVVLQLGGTTACTQCMDGGISSNALCMWLAERPSAC